MSKQAILLTILTIVIDISAISFGYMSLWVLGAFLTLVFVFSAFSIIYSVSHLGFNQYLPDNVAEKGSPAYLNIKCTNNGMLLYPRIVIYYINGDKKSISVFPGVQNVNVEYIFHKKGTYTVGIRKIIAYDTFCIFRRKIRFNDKKILYVTPKAGFYREKYTENATDEFENNTDNIKLEDKSMISYLRDYRYGDTLNNINWKATAKHNEVIVNQHENETHSRVFIYVDRSDNIDLDDILCDLALTRVRSVLNRDGLVTLLYSGSENALDGKNVKYFREYGVYLAKAPEKESPDGIYWPEDMKLIENIIFKNNIYNEAVLFFQRPVTAQIENLVRQMENIHIDVEVREPAVFNGNTYWREMGEENA